VLFQAFLSCKQSPANMDREKKLRTRVGLPEFRIQHAHGDTPGDSCPMIRICEFREIQGTIKSVRESYKPDGPVQNFVPTRGQYRRHGQNFAQLVIVFWVPQRFFVLGWVALTHAAPGFPATGIPLAL